jgi:protein SSD1
MTDSLPQPPPTALKEDRKTSNTGPPAQSNNGRGGPKKNNNPSTKQNSSAIAQGRPSSRTGNKKSTPAGESGSDTTKKGNEGRKVSDGRANKGSIGKGSHKKGLPSQSRPNSNTSQPANRQVSKSTSTTPAPTAGAETSDALSSLQRVIADLKTASPAGSQPTAQPQELVSNLPPNAPVFQPGMTAFPGSNPSELARHRKAASLGTGFGNNPSNSYSPHLGVMMEDAEDPTNGSYEEGEIQENGYRQQAQAHSRRTQSQSFTAPRFAALAAQQEPEVLGPTGRPQLAPGFMFGGNKRRGSFNTPMGPPINEEDLSFQFPQQQPVLDNQGQDRRDDNSGEIGGIMAEQVTLC